MRAIAAREFSAYFNTMSGYVFTSICLLVCGIFFAAENLLAGSASFTNVIGSLSYVLILITPLLTMRLFAEERKNKSEQMLLTAPISIPRIVVGKYLAAMAVLLIALLVSLIFPLILFLVGEPHISEILLGYLGVILLGSAFISIGMFISANTENQLTAAIFSMGALFLLWLMDAVIPSITNPLFSRIVNSLSLYNQFGSFQSGILSLPSIVYFISMTFLFLYFTVSTIEKRRWSKG